MNDNDDGDAVAPANFNFAMCSVGIGEYVSFTESTKSFCVNSLQNLNKRQTKIKSFYCVCVCVLKKASE